MAKKKIVVVDDEVDFLDLVKIRLEANNYQVVTASNGREGLEKIKKEKPDAVLLDILMPEMDGLKVLKAVRSVDKNMPIFIITAFSNEERFKVANQFNASGFILKTNDLQGEIDKITSLLGIAGQSKANK